MSEQAEKPQTDWSEVARETYGDEYHGDDSSNEVIEEPGVGKALTIDEAYERLQDEKDERSAQTRAKPKINPSAPESDSSDDLGSHEQEDTLWSTEDVRTMNMLEREVELFNKDYAAFTELKKKDISELAGGDKDKASMIRAQIREAEIELNQRAQALSQVANGFKGKTEQKTISKAKKQLAAETAKLMKEFPDFDKQQTRGYLVSKGFKADDIAQIGDSRTMAIVEKARRYDELMSGKKKVPQLRKGTRFTSPNSKGSEVTEALAKVKAHGRIDDAVEYLSLRRRAKA